MVRAPSGTIRVLVVDDSYFMKRLLSELLSAEKDMEVVGLAKTGEEAIEMADSLKPDVITMDYNMPGLNGVQAVKRILSGSAADKPGIVMVSAYTAKDSETALAALQAGAVDFVQKPSGELSFDIDKVRDELIAKVRAAARANVIRFRERRESTTRTPKRIGQEPAHTAIVIGASTGGPPLLEDILSELPNDLPSSVIVIQHMPDFFTRKFAERLDRVLPLSVRWAEDGDLVSAGTIFVIPSHAMVRLRTVDDKRYVSLCDDPECQVGNRPSIDRTMAECAKAFSSAAIGVILTGMGEDGTEGMKEIKKNGGRTIVQDPMSATVDSMPASVIAKGLADEILRPERIPARLVELSKSYGD